MSKHTPGPWAAAQFTGTYGGPDTWGVRLSNDTGITPMLEANARLIAAAPEMLEALQFGVNFWMKQRNRFKLSEGDVPNREASYLIEQMDVYIAKMQAAIAKAEGRD